MIVAGSNGSGGVDRYDAATRTVSNVPGFGAALNSVPVLDRHATRIVLNGTRICDADFQLLGELPAATKAVVLSPNGATAWTYDASGTVRKFDLAAPTTLDLFQEIGTGTALAASPDADGDGAIVMTSTPEAEVLFIAGDDGVVVQAAP
jgi:hypothetical protein